METGLDSNFSERMCELSNALFSPCYFMNRCISRQNNLKKL
ncbi:hypothetical protein HMPREF9514_01198 [Enterococcus faecalis TX0855]|nr:hypothetical protein HMPREF9514_01198 [Enterococcus faecalis TX0855]